jgi:carboxyl-terminal processing protease
VLLAATFAAGILVERSGRLFAPYEYTPPNVATTFAPFWQAWDLVERRYVDREAVQPERMTRGAIEGMLASLGDVGHTGFLTADEMKKLKSSMEGHLEGIGARMSMRKGQPTIVSTLPDSPARRVGLKPGDVLLQIDGKSVAGMPLDRIVSLITGQPGTEVQLRIAREKQTKPLDFIIDRAKVSIPEVTWTMVPGAPVAHIAIQTFGEQTNQRLVAALEEAHQRGAKGLLIDVRGNTGGLKEQAVAVTSQFLTEGNVFLEQDARGNRTPVPVLPGARAPDIPLCVLIDEGTASSSEIFAGAIQDHKRGKLVGTRSFGTGTVLEPFPLIDGSWVVLAISEWFTPDGRQIWHHGISPDVPIALPQGALILLPELEADMSPSQLAKTDDKQLLKALEVLRPQLH